MSGLEPRGFFFFKFWSLKQMSMAAMGCGCTVPLSQSVSLGFSAEKASVFPAPRYSSRVRYRFASLRWLSSNRLSLASHRYVVFF